MKNNKGITLIALIITIIVLLILSLVTINSLFSSDSAMEKARQAKESNEKGEISDMLALAVANIKLKQASTTEVAQKEWDYYYATLADFVREGSIDTSYKIYDKEANGDSEWAETKKYSFDSTTGVVKLTIKKIGGTGIEYEYELNVYSGNVQYAGSTQTNNSGSNDSSNGGSNNEENNSSEGQTYNITYTLNEGAFQTGQTPITTYEKGDIVSFLSPIKDGYAFDGWYTSSTFESTTRLSQTSANSSGNLTVYAKWISESNADYFKYSSADSNGNVSITGLTSSTDVAEGQVSGEEAYTNNNEDILNLVIPKKNNAGKTINRIANNVFKDRNKLTKVVLQSTIEMLGTQSFANCTAMTELTVPIALRTDGYNGYYSAFTGCTAIANIRIIKGSGENGGTGIDFNTSSSGNAASYENTPWYISNVENLQVEIENGITKLGNYTFYECDNLKMISLPNSVVTIGSGTFKNCTGMKGELFNISNLTSIGSQAFYGCTGITGKVEIPTGLMQLANSTFYGCSGITEVVIPSNIESLGTNSFTNCTGMTKLTVPIVMKSDGYNGYYSAFSGCTSIANIKIIKGNGENGGTGIDFNTYSSGNAGSYTNTPWYISNVETLEVEIESGITKIGNYTFYECDNLKMISLPNSVVTIGAGTFKNCTGMKGELFNISNLTSIGSQAFYGCTGITGKVEIPTGLTQLANSTFYGCSGITEVVIPSNIQSLGTNSFTNCTAMTKLTVPIVMKSGGYNGYYSAFSGCTAIEKIKIIKGNGENGSLGMNFSDSSSTGTANSYANTPWYISTANPKIVIIEKGITKIGTYTFYNTTNVTYYYTGTEEEWGNVTIGNGNNLTITSYNYSE